MDPCAPGAHSCGESLTECKVTKAAWRVLRCLGNLEWGRVVDFAWEVGGLPRCEKRANHRVLRVGSGSGAELTKAKGPGGAGTQGARVLGCSCC